MGVHKSMRPGRDWAARYSAIKDGSSRPGHNERNFKSIFPSLSLCCSVVHSLLPGARGPVGGAGRTGGAVLRGLQLQRHRPVDQGRPGPRHRRGSARWAEGKETPQWERGRKKKQQLAPHQAAGIKVKWRRGITQLRFRFSFDCKNPDKSYYACKSVGGFLTLREWALNRERERALRAERRVSDNLGKMSPVYHAELEKIPHSADKS